MKINPFKRIVVEDFDKKDQSLVGKLAYPINLLMEQFTTAMNNSISFSDNINVQVKDVQVIVDANGSIGTVSFKTTLKNKSNGIFCIKMSNLTSPGTLPTAAPFVSFTETSGQIVINGITGLSPSTTYSLRLVSIG